MAGQIPPWGRAHRRIEREAARELAKAFLKEGRRSGEFRLDITLACLFAVMGILSIIAPPQSRPTMFVWLIVVFAVGVYPALHFAELIPVSNKWIANVFGIVGLAVIVSILGYVQWPPIRRHLITKTERSLFENTLIPQKGSDLEVQVGCPLGDEKTCIYAGQFINLFGESEWKVQPLVSRLTLSKALDGVTVYRRGGNKEDMMKRWNSGGWFNLNEPRLLEKISLVVIGERLGLHKALATSPLRPKELAAIRSSRRRFDRLAPLLLRGGFWLPRKYIGSSALVFHFRGKGLSLHNLFNRQPCSFEILSDC